MSLLRLYLLEEKTFPGVWGVHDYSSNDWEDFRGTLEQLLEKFNSHIQDTGFIKLKKSVFLIEGNDGDNEFRLIYDLSSAGACEELGKHIQLLIYDVTNPSGNGTPAEPLSEEALEIAKRVSTGVCFLCWNDIVRNKNIEPMHAGRGADIDEPDDSPYLER